MDNLEKIIKDKLCEGLTIKNYKELCVLFNQSIKSGKSKQLQIKDWNRYFEFHKDGQKIIIDKILDIPIEKEDGRVNNEKRKKYEKYFTIVLLDLLSKEENMVATNTKSYWMVQLGMISNNYYNDIERNKILSDIEATSRKYSFSKHDVKIFDSRTYQILDRIFFDILDSLVSKFVISYNKEHHYRVYYSNGQYDEFICDKQQENWIREEKYNTLTELGMLDGDSNKYHNMKNPMFYICLNNKSDKYYTILNEKLLGYGMEDVRQYIRIDYKHEHIVDTYNREIVNLNKIELNNRIMDRIDKNAETKYNNLLNKYNDKLNEIYNEYLNDEEIKEWMSLGVDYSDECLKMAKKKMFKEKLAYKPSDNYVKNQKQLSQLLCCIDVDKRKQYLENKNNEDENIELDDDCELELIFDCE